MTPRLSLTRRTFKRFLRKENGQITIFTMLMFFLMVAFSGMAVDMMRQENARTDLQQTLDRALLAAASMRQQRSAEVVIRDYFTKAGKIDYLGTITASRANDSNVVSVNAQSRIDTYFMGLMDVDILNAVAGGRAEEGVSNTEISLVLDISGSMRFPEAGGGVNSQITRLRVAAKSFFAQILTPDARPTTSINVIPYAGQVNVGPLWSYFGATRLHNNSSCLDLPASAYTRANGEQLPAAGLTQTPHFHLFPFEPVTMDWGWCPQDRSGIIVAENDISVLNNFIDNVRLHDGTATHTGTKYGLMLLNPAMNPIFRQLVTNGVIGSQFNDRPRAFDPTGNTSETKKYLIIMTDGAITQQERPRFTGFNDPDVDNADNENIASSGTVNDPDSIDGTDHALLNATRELERQRSTLRGTATAADVQVGQFRTTCAKAKDLGVIVYTIAFNLPTSASTARTDMQNCASSPAYFYNVTSSDQAALTSVFTSIVVSIRALRLTQ